MNTLWVESEPAQDHQLTAQQIARWRNEGYALIHNLLPEQLLRAAVNDALEFFPAPNTDAARKLKDFGSQQRFVFPSVSHACNEITLHPHLLRAVAQLLGNTPHNLRLTQSDLWPKYGREPSTTDYDNADQRIHCDYPNHMLTHPPPWDQPEAVELIIYLNDFDQAHGATAVVPRQGEDDPAYTWPIVQTPGVGALKCVNDKTRAEQYLADADPEAAKFRADTLYAREAQARYQFGSVLLYRHDTWHRGTPVKTGALRLVHNMTFRKASAEWINVLHPGWSWSMYRPDQFMEKLVAEASPEQRSVMGFPAPGNDYWNEQTISAVQARYAPWGIDMTPYWEGISR